MEAMTVTTADDDDLPEATDDAVVEVQRHPRYPLPYPAKIATASGSIEDVTLEDVSLGGVFVRTEQPWPPRAALHIQLIVDDAPLVLGGRVAHVVTVGMSVAVGHAPGMGVSFDPIPADVEPRWQHFVQSAEREHRERAAQAVAAPAPVTLPQEAPKKAPYEEELPLVVGAKADATIEVKIAALLGEADAAEAANDGATARRFVEHALALKPGDAALQERLSTLALPRGRTRATSLLDEAVHGRGADAVEMVRNSVRLSQDRKVLARAIEAFTSLGASGDALLAAEYLVALYPDDVPTLSFLLETHVSAGRFDKAVGYGEALLRLAPGDASLRERVAKVANAARKK
jgi:hypothetical protein